MRRTRAGVGALAGAAILSALAAAPAPAAPSSVIPTWVCYSSQSASGAPAFERVLTRDASQARAVAATLRSIPGITSAAPSVPIAREGTPDPRVPAQWGLRALGATSAWSLSRGTGVVVAVVDGGVDRSHPDLAGRVLPGRNISSPNRGVDADPHGTHVAGIIAATLGNGVGGAGLAPGAAILPVDVFAGEDTDDCTVAKGMAWAADQPGVKVMNLSLGGADVSEPLRRASAYAQSRGIVVVAAAGNTGTATLNYPAAFPGVLGVGAITSSGARAPFSSTGSHVDLVAPGSGIVSTVPAGSVAGCASCRYDTYDGTSMATPFVSASAALLRARFPSWSAATVAAELTRTARDLGPAGRDNAFGYGLVQPLVDLVGAPDAPVRPASDDLVSTPVVTPATPTTPALAPSVRVNWTAPARQGSYGIASWRIWLSTDLGRTWTRMETAGASARTHVFANVAPGTVVRARVAAVAARTGAQGRVMTSLFHWHGVDPGDTLEAARTLAARTSATDVIRTATDADWYAVTVPSAFTVVRLTGGAAGTTAAAYPIVDGVVGSVPTATGTTLSLGPGTYVVSVTGPAAPLSPYTIART